MGEFLKIILSLVGLKQTKEGAKVKKLGFLKAVVKGTVTRAGEKAKKKIKEASSRAISEVKNASKTLTFIDESVSYIKNLKGDEELLKLVSNELTIANREQEEKARKINSHLDKVIEKTAVKVNIEKKILEKEIEKNEISKKIEDLNHDIFELEVKIMEAEKKLAEAKQRLDSTD